MHHIFSLPQKLSLLQASASEGDEGVGKVMSAKKGSHHKHVLVARVKNTPFLVMLAREFRRNSEEFEGPIGIEHPPRRE